jgi:hypothetical protein
MTATHCKAVMANNHQRKVRLHVFNINFLFGFSALPINEFMGRELPLLWDDNEARWSPYNLILAIVT